MQVKKNVVYNFLLTGSSLLFQLLTFPFLSRTLGAEGIGISNFITSYSQNFIIFAGLGIPVYGIREIAKYKADDVRRSKLYLELLTLHIGVSIAVLLVYLISVFSLTDLAGLKDAAIIAGAMILINVFSVEWLFTGLSEFKYIAIRSVVVRFLAIIPLFIWVEDRNDIKIYLFILMLTSLITAILDIHHSPKFIQYKTRLNWTDIARHLKPVSVLGLYVILTSLYSVLPTTILGFISTTSAVGYFSSANKIIRLVISFFSAIVGVLIPNASLTLQTRGEVAYLENVEKALSICIIVGIPASVLVFLLAEYAILTLAGPDFKEAITLTKIMSPIIFIVALAQVFVLLILNIKGRNKSMMLLALLGVSVSLSISFVFIPRFAQVASAYSQLVAETMITVCSFFLARKQVRFKFPVKRFCLNLICVIPFFAIYYLTAKYISGSIPIIFFTSFICTGYFILYQTFIIREKLIVQMIPFRKNFKRAMP